LTDLLLAHVLEGSMEIAVGERRFRLRSGDCLTMRLDQAVVFRNPTCQRARDLVALANMTSLSVRRSR
jgi:uncharacterized cupin superfamily protein